MEMPILLNIFVPLVAYGLLALAWYFYGPV